MASIETLTALAGGSKDDLSQYEELPEDLKGALQEMAVEQKKDALKSAAREIMSILDASKNVQKMHIEEVRRLRVAEASSMRAIKAINTAREYAKETNNWLPLAILAGSVSTYRMTDEQRKLSTVPEGWTPKSKVETPPSAA